MAYIHCLEKWSMLFKHNIEQTKIKEKKMRKLLLCLFTAMIPVLAQGAHHETEAEIRALAEAFNTAYATNKVDAYFGFYAEDAELYFYGARQDLAAYNKEWYALMAVGGGVAKNRWRMEDRQYPLQRNTSRGIDIAG
jgi:hypothetical protein